MDHGSELYPSHADAVARLRHVTDVRRRVRHSAMLPSLVLLGVGAVVAIRGGLLAGWPHSHALSIVWLLALVLARLLSFRWQSRRLEERRGLLLSAQVRRERVALGLLAAVVAIVVGANALITASAATIALWAGTAGRTAMAAVALAAGAIADVLIIAGVPRGGVMLSFGIALCATGLAARMGERAER